MASASRLTVVLAAGDTVTVARRNLRKPGPFRRHDLGRVPDVAHVGVAYAGRDLMIVAAGKRTMAWRWRRSTGVDAEWPPVDEAAWVDPVSAIGAGPPAGLVATGRRSGLVEVRAAATGEPVVAVDAHRDAVTALALAGTSAGVQVLSATVTGELAVTDVDGGRVWFRADVGGGREILTAGLVDLGGCLTALTVGLNGTAVTDLGTRRTTPVPADDVVRFPDRREPVDLGVPVDDVAVTPAGDFLALLRTGDAVLLRRYSGTDAGAR